MLYSKIKIVYMIMMFKRFTSWQKQNIKKTISTEKNTIISLDFKVYISKPANL